MPGRTLILGSTPNNLAWPIPREKAQVFEAVIGLYLRRRVATKDGKVKVQATRSVHDFGRDYEICATRDVTPFGIPLRISPTQPEARIFVECKSTNSERLDDEFLVDASQHANCEAGHYVLVTNSTITPYTQYRAQQIWRSHGMEFHMVDRWILLRALAPMAKEIQEVGLDLPALPDGTPDPLALEYQTERSSYVDNHTISIYLSARSYSDEPLALSLALASDNAWRLDRRRFSRILEPFHLETLSLVAERTLVTGTDTLRISVENSGRRHQLNIANTGAKLRFETPFTGSYHRQTADKIRELVLETTSFRLISIQGEAGVGKSRVLEESLRPLRHGRFEIGTHYFGRSPNEEMTELFVQFSCKERPYSGSARSIHPLWDFIKQLAANSIPAVVVLEDAHHANSETIDILKRLTLRPPKAREALVVILTGRDDFTFPNEDYFGLLRLLQTLDGGETRSFTVEVLEDSETEDLIRGIVENMPEPGVQKVKRLSENNPFIITEVLQYLLDEKLATLLSRRTIGILNVETFAGRTGLPDSVEEIHERRIESLRSLPVGQDAILALGVASFFGIIVDKEVLSSFLDGLDVADVWTTLLERGFVVVDPATSATRFTHENVLDAVRVYVLNEDSGEWFAHSVLARPATFSSLHRFDQGRLFVLARRWAEALRCFDPILKRVREITNFSSEEIDKAYFPFLEELYRAARSSGLPRQDCSKVATALAYMGVHNFPIYIGERSCARAVQMLEALAKGQDGQLELMAIRQLQAHALQNMGRTGEALRLMLELDAEIRVSSIRSAQLEFDLYDRLQEYSRKINHRTLATYYGQLARRAVEESHDDKLQAAHLITESICALYSKRSEALRKAARAHGAARRVGIARFKVYTRLSKLVAETLHSGGAVSKLLEIYEEAKDLLRLAARDNLSDSLMRVELLLGTLALQCLPEEGRRIASYYVETGQANSVRFGNGLFDWAFDNLAAVIERPDIYSSEVTRRRLDTCHERLRRRGLLFFGKRDGVHPNYLVFSNIVRYFGSLAESEGVAYFRTADAYERSVLDDEDLSREEVERAVSGWPIMGPRRPKATLLRYPPGNGYFTPVY